MMIFRPVRYSLLPFAGLIGDAFVNTDYPVYPIDLGVVTLDAINDSGFHVPGSSRRTRCIHCRSSYFTIHSPGFSFFACTQGIKSLGFRLPEFLLSAPGKGISSSQHSDSLVLQFLLEPKHDSISPVDTTLIPDRWRRIWSCPGMALDSFIW